MIARLFKAAATNRVPVLSYIHEASLSTGAGLGLITAMSGLAKISLPLQDPLIALSQSAYQGAMIVTVGYVLPMTANFIDLELRGKEPKIFDLLEEHAHKPSRLTGLATGAALSLILVWNGIGPPGSGPQIDFTPVMDRLEQISADLGHAAHRSSPYMAFNNHL